MYRDLPFSLVILVSITALQTAGLPGLASAVRSSLSSLISRETRSDIVKRQSSNNFEIGTNGSQFLWLIQDTYQGQSFFEWVSGYIYGLGDTFKCWFV